MSLISLDMERRKTKKAKVNINYCTENDVVLRKADANHCFHKPILDFFFFFLHWGNQN